MDVLLSSSHGGPGVHSSDRGPLTFGRGAELDVDSNPFLHRSVGRFVFTDGMWWVENLSDRSPLRINAGETSVLLAANDRSPLTQLDTTICFDAGPCNYQIHVHLDEIPEVDPPLALNDDRTVTLNPVVIPLNDEQRLLLAALAEPWLKDRHHRGRMPTNRSVADRLGWTDTKFNRKLDYLCGQLARNGVPGMRVNGQRALERRNRLVEHMLLTGQINSDDLILLTTYDRGTPT